MPVLEQWRKWLRPLVMAIYVILLIIAIPLCVWELNTHEAQIHVQGWFIGGIFVLFSIPITLWGILQHLVNYTQPFLQRHIIRILWMVPIYALNAWFALKFPEAAIYLDTVRECYEAYVIYNFMIYLLNYLRSEYPDLEGTLECKPQVKHLIPFCCLPPWRMGGTLIQHCKHGVLQYTVVRPVTTIIALFCQWGNVYHEGDFNFKSAWSYLVIINNISQICAMYCLVLFYQATKQELKPLKPLSKFMCVKAVVFLSFWQAVLIAMMVKFGVIQDNPEWEHYTVERVATGIQDFCICIEMFLAAVAHYFSFSHVPYIDNGHEQVPCCQLFISMCDVSDVHADIYEHARFVGKTVQGAVVQPIQKQWKQGNMSERQPLLTDLSPTHGATSHRSSHPPIPLQVMQRRESISATESDDGSELTFKQKSMTESMVNYVQFEDSISTEPRNKVLSNNADSCNDEEPDLIDTSSNTVIEDRRKMDH